MAVLYLKQIHSLFSRFDSKDFTNVVLHERIREYHLNAYRNGGFVEQKRPTWSYRPTLLHLL